MGNEIRLATPTDAAELLGIYSYYVEDTCISFETETPSLSEFESRIESITSFYPYLVYLSDGRPVGYAYASRFKERAGYRFDAEVSVYISRDHRRQGIGSRLYGCLLKILKEQGFYNIYAGIGTPNEGSMSLHRKFGFYVYGTARKTGYKHGKWLDVTYLAKNLRPYDDNPTPVKPISLIPDEFLNELFKKYAQG